MSRNITGTAQPGIMQEGRGGLQVVGQTANAGSVVYDAYLWLEGKNSAGRFWYNTTGTMASWGSSMIIGGTAGTGVGVMVGGTFIVGQISYDSIQNLNEHQNKMHEKGMINHRNEVTSWDDFVNDLFFWLNY